MSSVDNVSVGKPKVGGAIFRGATGTTLPTDATTALDAAFVNLGYVSDEGLKNNNSPESDTVKAWGGDIVLTTQEEKPDTFTFTLLESLNVDVLSAVYNSANVSGTLATGITVKANAKESEAAIWVFELLLRGGAVKRVVLPNAVISEVGEISYVDGEPVGYPVTLQAFPNSSGDTHYEYIFKA